MTDASQLPADAPALVVVPGKLAGQVEVHRHVGATTLGDRYALAALRGLCAGLSIDDPDADLEATAERYGALAWKFGLAALRHRPTLEAKTPAENAAARRPRLLS